MFTPLYRKLLSGYPFFRQVLWQWLYQNLARNTSEQPVLFMNYGYAALDGKEMLQLGPEDEPNRLSIQLYCHILRGLEIKDRDCLEVGSGRGGGVMFVANHMGPRSILGVDLSPKAVELCNRMHQNGGPVVKFVVGSAENLPVQSHTIDLVLNVESSHCYSNIAKFISEVRRVLRPGGHFAWADLQPTEAMLKFDYEVQRSGLSVLKREDITPNIIKSLELMDRDRSKFIEEYAPHFLRKDMMNFMGTKDGIIYQQLVNGQIVYMHYQMQKIQ